jgi:hypothetical protein
VAPPLFCVFVVKPAEKKHAPRVAECVLWDHTVIMRSGASEDQLNRDLNVPLGRGAGHDTEGTVGHPGID